MPDQQSEIAGTKFEAAWPLIKSFLFAIGISNVLSPLYKLLWARYATKAEPLALATSLLIALAGTVVWKLWLWLDSKNFKAFFGLIRDREVLIIMPSWTTGIGQTLGKRNYEKDWRFETRATRAGASTSQANINTLREAIEGNTVLRGLRPRYCLDETVFAMDTKTPKFMHRSEREQTDVTVIAYGASSSNYICRYVLQQPIFRKDPRVYHFVGEIKPGAWETDYHLGRIEGEVSPGDGLPSRYEDVDYDYALLIRLTLKHSFPDGHTVTATIFVCAGLNAEGSQGTLDHLLKHWRRLEAANEGRDFYYLFRVNRDPLKLEETLLHGVRSPDGLRFVFDGILAAPDQSNMPDEQA